MKVHTFLADNLRNGRKRKGLTQQGFAEILGIKRSLLGAYEEGRAEPSIYTLQKIANFFNVSMEVMILQDAHKVIKTEDQPEPKVELKIDDELMRKFGLIRHLVDDIQNRVIYK